MSRFYITTPIYYVNDHPHIGHIYTTLVADTIARYRRLCGDSVYFLTGTDEHGQNIERAADQRGVEPIALADEVVSRYHLLWKQLGITHQDFIRTSEERHKLGVEAVIRSIADADDFYLSHHEGWYCSSCEAFYTEKELVTAEGTGGLCPTHQRQTEWRSEENLFFRLSKYQDALLELYDRGFVAPESRANEVRQFVASGLRDLSVSRTNVAWAIPFPGYSGHTVYVWLDALTNYISALGYGRESAEADLYRRFWEEGDQRVHLVGKDILRFHAVYWPAFLLSARLPLPTKVWAHGWWLRDDQKISKSVGNIVRPDELIEKFGTDSLRYFLLREMVFGQDASFSDEAFIDRYNSDLANDLGNTTSRLVTLTRRAFDGCLPPTVGDSPLAETAAVVVAEFRDAMERYAFNRALESLWKLLAAANQYLVVAEPWKRLADPDAAGEISTVLWNALEAVRVVASGLAPFLPEKSLLVLAAIGAPPVEGLEALEWGRLPTGAELPALEPIFPRIDKKRYLGAAVAASRPKAGSATPDAAAEDQTPRASIGEFLEIELKVATVKAAAAVAKSKKLVKLSVDLGEGGARTLVAGIAHAYAPEDLVGRQVVVVANLEPAKLMGVESNGMVLAATADGKPVLLRPDSAVPDGTRVR